MQYTWRLRYEDTSNVTEENPVGEYKTCEFVAKDLNEALCKWKNEISTELLTDPYKVWSFQTVWTVSDKEKYKDYWSGEKEDEIYKNFTREMDAIFLIMTAVRADEGEIYELLKKRGYTKASFVGTRYYKWIVSCEKTYGEL